MLALFALLALILSPLSFDRAFAQPCHSHETHAVQTGDAPHLAAVRGALSEPGVAAGASPERQPAHWLDASADVSASQAEAGARPSRAAMWRGRAAISIGGIVGLANDLQCCLTMSRCCSQPHVAADGALSGVIWTLPPARRIAAPGVLPRDGLSITPPSPPPDA